MSEIADEYEQWFAKGKRGLAEFAQRRELTDDEFEDCLFADLHLRHSVGEPLDVAGYVKQFSRIASNHELQVELWLEAYGYFEESDTFSTSIREAFLTAIPDAIRATVTQQLANEPAPLAPAVDDVWPVVPRYRIDREIGRGAFGVVYQAWDTQLDRSVALKVLHSQSNQSDEDLFAEARLVAKLDAPGIISIYDCGTEASGRAYFVTAYLDGIALHRWAESLESGQWVRVCQLFIRLCDSLTVAHTAGIVHRDLKPSNIIVREGEEPCLLDFGLAISSRRLGRKGEWVGTPAYMSPEQARGEGHLVDERSDVFSIGILLIEVLSGKRPWVSKSSGELLQEISIGNVTPVRNLNEDIPETLQRICAKATASSMSGRYQLASEMADDLRWFIGNDRERSRDSLSQSSPIGASVASRGLRPYTADDGKAYWQLIPGYRNVRGVPEAVQWWLQNLEGETHEQRGVLVLSGPSGSGKSSLMHAGVLPALDRTKTQTVQVDASEMTDASSMKALLANVECQNSDETKTLPEMCVNLREHLPHRLVIVIDQFEQVLAWTSNQERGSMLRAMRQADGCQLQFVLVVRDEFWSAMNAWMRDLDAPLRDGRNAMSLQRFTREHAIKVLRIWAKATEKPDLDEAFLQGAMELVEVDGRVVPVRLALLASVLGDGDWTSNRLTEVAKNGSLSGYYLDAVLGDHAPTRSWPILEPARAILRYLTPPTGLMRGPARSIQELQQAISTHHVSNDQWDELLDLLDRQLHLITPTEIGQAGCEIDESSQSLIHYQLSHDFLVPELRSWFDASDANTVRGRAAVDLKRATWRWMADVHPRNLAGPVDCVRFGFMTKPRDASQRSFVKASARRQLLRAMTIAALAAVLCFGFQWALLHSNGKAIVDRLVSSSIEELPDSIMQARRHRYWTESPLRQQLTETDHEVDLAVRDRVSLALLNQDPTHAT
ncbi:MAG: serine/threonine-protein kinase, partial [Planctomycetota bacterium]